METRESYISPDGSLTLLVLHRDGDITLGFEGYAWHTHGGVLSGEYELGGESGISPEAATKRFVADILESRAIIALSRMEGRVRDVWVTDSPKKEFSHMLQDESIECRYWDGTPWHAS